MSHTINISHKELVSYADLHHYLKNVSLINVELNENTSDFLNAFYVASRRVRTSIPHGTEIPTKALKSLYVISKMSHYKDVQARHINTHPDFKL